MAVRTAQTAGENPPRLDSYLRCRSINVGHKPKQLQVRPTSTGVGQHDPEGIYTELVL